MGLTMITTDIATNNNFASIMFYKSLIFLQILFVIEFTSLLALIKDTIPLLLDIRKVSRILAFSFLTPIENWCPILYYMWLNIVIASPVRRSLMVPIVGKGSPKIFEINAHKFLRKSWFDRRSEIFKTFGLLQDFMLRYFFYNFF